MDNVHDDESQTIDNEIKRIVNALAAHNVPVHLKAKIPDIVPAVEADNPRAGGSGEPAPKTRTKKLWSLILPKRKPPQRLAKSKAIVMITNIVKQLKPSANVLPNMKRQFVIPVEKRKRARIRMIARRKVVKRTRKTSKWNRKPVYSESSCSCSSCC